MKSRNDKSPSWSILCSTPSNGSSRFTFASYTASRDDHQHLFAILALGLKPFRPITRGKEMKKLIATLMSVIFAAAPLFAQTIDNHEKAKRGAAIGGVAGAIAGAIIGRHKGHTTTRGAVVGGVVGAATGAVVGNMMDKQER